MFGAAALDAWADRLSAGWRASREVYASFNNGPDAVATMNARTLRDKVRARMA